MISNIIINEQFYEVITKVVISSCLGLILTFTKFQLIREREYRNIRFFIISRVIFTYLLFLSLDYKVSTAILALILLRSEMFYKGKDSKIQNDNDIMHISVVACIIGLLISSNHILIAIIITIIFVTLSYIIFYFNKRYSKKYLDYQLQITVPENLDYTIAFNDLFDKYFEKIVLSSIKTTSMGSLFELKYYVWEKENIDEKKMIDEFRVINSNLPIIVNKDFY